MLRVLRACSGFDCAHRMRHAGAAPSASTAACRGCSGSRSHAGFQAAIRHFRLRHGGHGQGRCAGRRFLRICQRHLGEEHADPRRQGPLRHVQRARRPVEGAHARRSSKSRRRTRTARSAMPTPASWTKLRSRRKGLTPFDPWLNEVRGIKSQEGSREALFRCGQARDRHSVPDVRRPGPQGIRPICAERHPGRARDARSRLLSVDRSQARRDEERNISQHLTNVLTLAGEQNAAARAKAILDLETKIAQVHWTRAESRDATKTYNKMSLAEVRKVRAGLRLPGASERRRRKCRLRRSSPSRARSRASPPCSAGRRWRCCKDQLLVRSLDAYSAYLPQEVRPGELRLLRHRPVGNAAAGAAMETRGEFHRRSARRRRQPALRRQIFPAGDEGRSRPARPQPHRRDGPADRPARLDEPAKPRRRRTPSSPPSRRRSAIPRSGGT